MNKAFEKILERLEREIAGKPTPEEYDNGINKAFSIVQAVAKEYNGGWIPVKTRPMTEEEKEYYSEFLFEVNGFIYECTLPDDGQEVLVATKFGVDKTTFYTDFGSYFENYEDEGEVIAWMELPKFESEE